MARMSVAESLTNLVRCFSHMNSTQIGESTVTAQQQYDITVNTHTISCVSWRPRLVQVWAKVSALEHVKCSGNWMWAAKLEGEGWLQSVLAPPCSRPRARASVLAPPCSRLMHLGTRAQLGVIDVHVVFCCAAGSSMYQAAQAVCDIMSELKIAIDGGRVSLVKRRCVGRTAIVFLCQAKIVCRWPPKCCAKITVRKW